MEIAKRFLGESAHFVSRDRTFVFSHCPSLPSYSEEKLGWAGINVSNILFLQIFLSAQ